MPIRAKDGCYVITVLDREPAPQDEELVRRLRIARAEQLSAGILKGADVKFTNADQRSAEEKK